MGYTTEFDGLLKFKHELKASEIVYLKTILGEDCRDHNEWNATDLTHIDYELSDDYSGIQWDGSEKFYDAIEKAELIIKLMNNKFNNDFGLIGKLNAQGEKFDDRWILECNDKECYRIDVILTGKKIQCPHCEEYFILEESDDR